MEGTQSIKLAALEEQYSNLAEIEVDKVAGLVGNIGAKVAADDAMPSWVVFLVELFLDVCGNVLFNVEFLERLRRAVYRILLHVLRHVRILDYCLSVRHGLKLEN